MSQPKRILHIITGLNDGGAEAVLTRLCLNSTGAEHVVISLMDEGKYGSILESAGVRVHCIGMNPGRLSLTGFWKLVQCIRSEAPYAVQTWMYHADFVGGIAAKVSGVKKIFWGIRQTTLEKGKAKRLTIVIARLCALLSNAIPEKIVCCAHKALEVHRSIGYSSNKLIVIPNGYDLSKFKPDDDAGVTLRSELGVPSDTFLIGMVGRYHPIKDHANLLSAIAELRSARVDFKCLLVGYGLSPDNSGLMTQIKELDLSDDVILAGQRFDIPAVMSALDLHVLSSSAEGFPNVVAEAMACGTPAVSTDVGDASEIVGYKSLLCPPRDAQALAKLITVMRLEWQEKPDTWNVRSTECVQHIQNNFSIEKMVAAYEDCWFDGVTPS